MLITIRYMAPEILRMKHDKSAAQHGYSSAVDWWSLGILTAKLLTGHTPYGNLDVTRFLLYLRSCRAAHVTVLPSAPYYTQSLDNLIDSNQISDGAVKFIRDLLCIEEESRLGAGDLGDEAVRYHPFFSSICWEDLEQKHVEPPFIPEPYVFAEKPQFQNIEALLGDCMRAHWMHIELSTTDDANFSTW